MSNSKISSHVPSFLSDMTSSKELARSISSSASLGFFLVVIFQVPLFRVGTLDFVGCFVGVLIVVIFQVSLFRIQCESGVCKSPLKITSSQCLANEVFPEAILKAILYPGSVLNSIIEYQTLPAFNELLNSFVEEDPAPMDIQHVEVLVGSYLMVVGAFMSVVKPGRMSFFGTVITTWGIMSSYSSSFTTQLYPTIVLAIVLAFLSIRTDVRKIVRTFKGWDWPIHLKQKNI